MNFFDFFGQKCPVKVRLLCENLPEAATKQKY